MNRYFDGEARWPAIISLALLAVGGVGFVVGYHRDERIAVPRMDAPRQRPAPVIDDDVRAALLDSPHPMHRDLAAGRFAAGTPASELLAAHRPDMHLKQSPNRFLVYLGSKRNEGRRIMVQVFVLNGVIEWVGVQFSGGKGVPESVTVSGQFVSIMFAGFNIEAATNRWRKDVSAGSLAVAGGGAAWHIDAFQIK